MENGMGSPMEFFSTSCNSVLGTAEGFGVSRVGIFGARVRVGAGVVGVAVLNRFAEAQRRVAYTQMKQIGEALELYKLANRHYPTTAEGLTALIQPKGNQKPFMTSIPKDPWDADYVYIYPGSHNTTSFDIMSYGPDGVQGGGDDINNWESPDTKTE